MLNELNNISNVVGVSMDGNKYRLDMMDSSMRYATDQEVMAATMSLKIDELKLSCKSAIEGGFVSSALGEPLKYDSMLPQDQINLLGAVMSGKSLYFTCTDANGIKKQRFHSLEEITKVFRDGAEHIEGNKALLWTKVAQVMSAKSLEEVAGIV